MLEYRATLKTLASLATEAVATQIAHQLRHMESITLLRELTIKDRRTCAPVNERIDLNRKIKEHKVLIIEGSRSDVGLYLIPDEETESMIDTDWWSFSENTRAEI